MRKIRFTAAILCLSMVVISCCACKKSGEDSASSSVASPKKTQTSSQTSSAPTESEALTSDTSEPTAAPISANPGPAPAQADTAVAEVIQTEPIEQINDEVIASVDQPEAKENLDKFYAAVEKLKQANTLELHNSLKSKFTTNDYVYRTNQDYDYKFNVSNKSNPKFTLNMKLIDGVSPDSTANSLTVSDGWLYVAGEDDKIRTQHSAPTDMSGCIQDLNNILGGDATLLLLESVIMKDDVSNIAISTDNEGNTIYLVKFNLDQINARNAQTNSSDNITELKERFVFDKDDMLKSIDVYETGTTIMEGQQWDTILSMNISVKVNQSATIWSPDDAGSYRTY